MSNDIFKTGLGLDSPLAPQFDTHLPEARDLVHNLKPDVGLADLYTGNSFHDRIAQAFEFTLKNVDLLQPNKIERELENIMQKLGEIRDNNIEDFLNADVKPLLNNADLLRVYTSMMLN
ncbi:hypothetical protein [Succinimonas amylolytica]|uniref:type III secretion apparatus assembly protein SctX n=1 Tax=Succinimonas amylolytica TaxID=83769 RepID=UPI00037260F8|nr:hypothetical protein [Succinimonas amylolytica]